MTPDEDELHQNISRYVAQNLTGVEPPSSADAAAGTMRDVPDETPDDAAPGMGDMRAPPSALPGPSGKAPPVDTSKPLGWAAPAAPKAPATDTGLRDAMGQDEKSKAMGKLGQSITAYAERPQNFADYAIGLGRGGKSAPPAHNATWDEQAASGDNAVSKLMATRKADADIASQQAAAAKAAQAKDPNSETAKTYRTVLLKFAPDLADQLNGATPEQMERIAPWLEKYATENGVALKARAGAEAKAKEDADRKAQHDADKAAAAATHEADKIDAGKRSDRNHEDSLAMQRALFGLSATKFKADEIDKVERAQDAADAKDQAGAQHLGDKAGEGQAVAKALDEVDAVIAKNPDDIPGVGKWKSKIPDVLAGSILSDEGMGVRNNAKDVLRTLLHKRSGAAVSPSELNEYMTTFGLNGTDEQFKAGVARMRRDFAAELGATQAGVSPGARQKFKESGGLLAEDIAPTAKSAKASPGPGYVRGSVDGHPGWVNKTAGEWEPD